MTLIMGAAVRAIGISVRLNEYEHSCLQKYAAERGMDKAAVLREMLQDHIVAKEGDGAAVKILKGNLP